MNSPIRKVAAGCLLLCLALLANITYVQAFQSDELNSREDNRRVLIDEYARERGPILVGDEAIASSVPTDGEFAFRREYHQHGQSIFYLTASFHVAEEGFDHQDAMPDTPLPGECPTLAEIYEQVSKQPRENWEREWAALDIRYAGDSRPGSPWESEQHPALARLWMRAASTLPDDATMHACVLTYASDLSLLGATLVPHNTFIGAPNLRPASLDHSMWFHRPFRADEWMLYDQVSPSASGARGLAIGRIFTEDGRLVATVAQEGLIRRVTFPSSP